MKKSQPYPKPIFLAAVVLILATLACRIMSQDTNNEDVNMVQTLEARMVTEAALPPEVIDQPIQPTEEIISEEPVEPTEEIIPEEPVPTEIETVDKTETVEVSETPDVLYEGISFSFSPNVAQSASAETIPGEDFGPDAMPGMTYPTHFTFTLSRYAVDDHQHLPTLIIYPVADYRAISSAAAETIDNLEQLIRTQSPAGFNDELPFLPMWPAAQIFNTGIEFIDFENGSGVRFLTMYGQDMGPINNQRLFYTFQGLTDDGRYYISAVLPVTHPGLPEDGSETVDDWQAFEDSWEGYLTETTTWLDAQAAFFFNPMLTDLDAMIASIQVDR